jgi:hypothetical protein
MQFLEDGIYLMHGSVSLIGDPFPCLLEIALTPSFAVIELASELRKRIACMQPDRYQSVVGIEYKPESVGVAEVGACGVAGCGDEVGILFCEVCEKLGE